MSSPARPVRAGGRRESIVAHGLPRQRVQRGQPEVTTSCGRRHLEHVLRVYRRHYNEHRPHCALDLRPPDGPIPSQQATAAQRVRRRDLLGGLIHEYEAAA